MTLLALQVALVEGHWSLSRVSALSPPALEVCPTSLSSSGLCWLMAWLCFPSWDSFFNDSLGSLLEFPNLWCQVVQFFLSLNRAGFQGSLPAFKRVLVTPGHFLGIS